MKKILAWVLLLVMLLGMLAGCQKPAEEPDTPPATEPSVEQPSSEEPVAPQGPTAEEAMAYLRAIYKDTEEPTPTPVNYDRYGVVRIAGVPFTVVWTVDVGEDLIKIVVNEDASVTIDVNETCEVATPYSLTATITDEFGGSASHSWDMLLPAAADMTEIVKTAYALAPGESLPYESTLRGKITAINTVYSAEYKNITVTIAVEGVEDMPIECYRLKGDGIADLAVGNIITVTGTLKNYNGKIEFDAGCTMDAWEKGDAVETPTDIGTILKAAYNLSDGQALPYPVTMTGLVTAIDSPYDPAYGNISVIMVAEGYSNYPIIAFRLKGVDVSKIAVNDTITVTGIIKNYKGKIEFDAGCQLLNRVSGGGVAQQPSSDPVKILGDAVLLAPGEKLPYKATLTGEIVSVDQAYDPGYGNVTVTMKVNGTKIQCYRLKGDGADKIRVTDKITVSGIIENYNGKLEFGSGCTLDSWTMGSRVTPIDLGPLKTETAYILQMKQATLGKTLYFNGQKDGSYLATSENAADAVKLYVEQTEGKGVHFYFMNGTTKTYVELESYTNKDGNLRARPALVSSPSVYWTYETSAKVYTVELSGTKYFLGTYGSYNTISSSSTYYITDGNASTVGKTQFVAEFILPENAGGETPDVPTSAFGTYTTAPEVGVAYKLGLDQTAKNETYYFTGAMSGYYGATEADYAKGVDVYLETADGGYYLYFMDGSAKQYIYIVASGTHMNFTFSTSNKSVFVFDETLSSLYTTVDGSVYYMGTYSNYVTVGTTAQSKVETSYVTHLYTSGTGSDTPDTPVVPEEPSEGTVVDTPVAGTAYKFGMVQKNVSETDVYYLIGGMSGYYMATGTDTAAAIDVYLEETTGGYYMYTMVDGAKTYINMVVSGTHVNGAYEATASTVYTYDAEAKTVIATVNDAPYWFGTRNDASYTTVGPVKTEYNGFYCQFYTASSQGGETPDTPVDPDEPVTGNTATQITELPKDGDVIVIVNDTTAMTGNADGNKLAGEAATIAGDKLTLTDAMAQLTVAIDANGYYTFTVGGKYLTSGETGNSLTLADAASDYSLWTVEAAVDGTFYIKNVNAQYNGNGQSLEVYQGKFTTYGHKDTAIYQMKLFAVSAAPAAPTGGQQMTSAPVAGDVIVVVNDTLAMTGTADGNKLAGETATITDGVLTLTDTMAQLTVAIDANGYYTFTAGGKYLTSGETGNSLTLADAASDYSLWTVEAAVDGTFYIKNVNAQFNGNGQSLEVYQGKFTTYGHKDTAIYQMKLFKVGAGSDTPDTPVVPDEPETPELTGGVTLTFDDVAKRTSVSTEQQVWEENGIVFTNDKAASASNVNEKYYAPLRAYKGSSIKIEYAGMTKLVFDCSGLDAKYVDALVGLLPETATSENGMITVTFETAQDVFEIAELSIGQVRINAVTVFGENTSDEPETPDTPDAPEGAPEVGVAYKWAFDQTTLGTTFYFAGDMNGYYGATTENFDEAVDVMLETANSGYYITFTDANGAKKYVNVTVKVDGSKTHYNFTIADAADTVYTYNSEYNTMVTVIDGTEFYFGTYSNFTTFGVSKISYISTSYAAYFLTEKPAEEEVDLSKYKEMTIAEARDAATGTLVKVSGVVARITYATGMAPAGVVLVDETSSIYVYDAALANKCAIGDTVSIAASKTYWILETEQTNAAKYGYLGCNQLENVEIISIEKTEAEFATDWIEETTVKEIMDTPVSEDITTKIFKVTAQVKEAPGNGFTNYYINDLDGKTGSYSYSQCNGNDFEWLREFDGKICTVYVMALNAKSSASGCNWRFLPIAVKDEGFDPSTVNFAENAVKYYGVDQFLDTYTGDPAAELVTSVDNELLGYTGATLSYASSDPSIASVEDGVLHCYKTGNVKITVTGTYGEQTYSEDVSVFVKIIAVDAEYPTVADAVAADLDATVIVKGIVGPSLVNKDGFYLIDETGVIAVLASKDTLATLELGYEVVLEGVRAFHSKSGGNWGNSCIQDAEVLFNNYGSHEYSTASFDGTLTLAEFKALDVNTDYTTSVFTVTATIEVVETAFYTNIKLVDGDVSINLYCSSANQYSWLKEYAGQAVTMELAPCNWSSKNVYPACVLAVVHENGTKTVNTLNFN